MTEKNTNLEYLNKHGQYPTQTLTMKQKQRHRNSTEHFHRCNSSLNRPQIHFQIKSMSNHFFEIPSFLMYVQDTKLKLPLTIFLVFNRVYLSKEVEEKTVKNDKQNLQTSHKGSTTAMFVFHPSQQIGFKNACLKASISHSIFSLCLLFPMIFQTAILILGSSHTTFPFP